MYETAPQVRKRYGGISDTTLWRWTREVSRGFPQPIYIGARRYFAVADLDAFERRSAKSVR